MYIEGYADWWITVNNIVTKIIVFFLHPGTKRRTWTLSKTSPKRTESMEERHVEQQPDTLIVLVYLLFYLFL